MLFGAYKLATKTYFMSYIIIFFFYLAHYIAQIYVRLSLLLQKRSFSPLHLSSNKKLIFILLFVMGVLTELSFSVFSCFTLLHNHTIYK